MRSITSVSGGKTSSYMALKYPTDFNVFACVLSEKESVQDRGLLKQIQDRIPHFIGSHEDEITLKAVIDLEQMLGNQINWVSSVFTLENFIRGETDLPGYRSSQVLPNSQKRFCTQQCKISPIFNFCHNMTDGDPVMMNIGFRFDEERRVKNWKCENDTYKYAKSCNMNGRYNWETVKDWRVTNFPLYHDKIDKLDIIKFWSKLDIKFPSVSNCLFCFHHTDKELQVQKSIHPEMFNHWNSLEKGVDGGTFGKRALEDIVRQPLLDVFGDDNQSCNCTD